MPDAYSEPIDPPSAFFREHEAALVSTRRLGPALDLACGRGRHARALAEAGLTVVALDRNPQALASMTATTPSGPQAVTESALGRITCVQADLEVGPPPVLEAAAFGAVLVFRYLHRPLMPWIERLLAPGGLLIYETFTRAQRSLGWGPERDAFLLESGELPTLFPGLEVLVFEEGLSRDARPAETARLLARRPTRVGAGD